jgi:large subunit ribosomal protein L17
MRHRNFGVKLNRSTSHRQAMFRNMVTSLFKYDRIRTTDVKAKELRRWVDQIVTLAKRGDLHARRQAMAILQEKDVVHKLFEEAGKRFGAINGGYTRIVKIGRRPGDAAPISLVELVNLDNKSKKESKKSKSSAKKKDAKADTKTAEKTAVEKTPQAESKKAEISAESVAEVSDGPVEAESKAEKTVAEAKDSQAEILSEPEGPEDANKTEE